MDPSLQYSCRSRSGARARQRLSAWMQCAATLLVVASALVLTTSRLPAQSRPALADFYTPITSTVIDRAYAPLSVVLATEDLNGDGHQDLVVLGANYPQSGIVNVPQPGRVFFGDGDGHFVPAPTSLFPVDTLLTVHASGLFSDFNGDGRADMFIAEFGFDAPPWPGRQNRLYLSRPEGGWQDTTATLPQLSDTSHSAAVGDVSGRGAVDIFVGNTFANSDALPYFLLNTGSGLFTLTRDIIPVGRDAILDTSTYHIFPGETLADLDGDGLPELIVTADASVSFKKLRQTTILWNRAGAFAENDSTALPAPKVFVNTRLDHNVQHIDVNQDGLPDLVVVGTQAGYSGWFVQIFVNKGNRRFVDETADRLPQGEASGGTAGEPAPYPSRVQVLDFNQDGAPDFFVSFSRDLPSNTAFTQGQPLVWLNDGAGRFSTLKVGDFIAPGQESLLGGKPYLMATRHGYSFITLQNFGATNGLRVTGLLATKPYRVPSASERSYGALRSIFPASIVAPVRLIAWK